MSDTIMYYTGLLTWLIILLVICYCIYVYLMKPLHKHLIKQPWYYWIVDTIMFPINYSIVGGLNKEQSKIMVEHFRFREIWTHRILKRKLEKIANE